MNDNWRMDLDDLDQWEEDVLGWIGRQYRKEYLANEGREPSEIKWWGKRKTIELIAHPEEGLRSDDKSYKAIKQQQSAALRKLEFRNLIKRLNGDKEPVTEKGERCVYVKLHPLTVEALFPSEE